MNRKYLNEAIIGNNEIVASFSKKGEMLRLFYPTRDYKQFVDCMYTGVKVNDSAIIYLHDDINNVYSQYYTENTNILNTKIKNTYFNLSILQTDFAAISQNILVKKLVFTNENTIDLNVNFIVYSKLLSDFNNMVGSKIENDILMQYSHDYTYCTFSKTPIKGHRLNNSKEEIKSGILKDKDYIGMSNDSAISFEIGNLKAGESKEIEIIIYINNNLEQYQFDEIISDVEKIRKIDINKELEKVEKYWQNYVKKHDGLKVIEQKEKWQKLITGQENLDETTYKKYEQMKNVYVRSILLFPLLTNAKTGGISAAIEIDEEREKSGRYSYCWPRDAVFVTKALDILNMKEETTKFYLKFCKKTQSQNGMWEQRFYTDGRLAPCWGYQIDETASIIYGIYEHYKETQNKEFLKQAYPMCQKAIDALGTFLNASSVPFASKENKNQENMKNFITHESYDLWEMHEGVHLYSMAAMYASYKAMLEIEKVLEQKEHVQEMKLIAEKLKEYCKKSLYNEEEKTLKRSNKDNICDISMLGTVTPFNMFKPNEKEVINTVEKMNMTLRTYTGGYIRFENDNYMGGNNPWPVATLWMALYNLKMGKAKEAMEQIEFVIKTATKHGFLAEQINNETMQANWVIGLGWSHAMFILALKYL